VVKAMINEKLNSEIPLLLMLSVVLVLGLWASSCEAAGGDGDETVTYTLSVTIDDSGGESACRVDLDPPGGIYTDGTTVTLTAVPDAGWYFENWTGDPVNETGPKTATILMDSDKSVTALFGQPQ
jgi:hypothetical protein